MELRTFIITEGKNWREFEGVKIQKIDVINFSLDSKKRLWKKKAKNKQK